MAFAKTVKFGELTVEKSRSRGSQAKLKNGSLSRALRKCCRKETLKADRATVDFGGKSWATTTE
jgi:hypothetical protein